ncbi:hypothetical protein Clacol_010402 [Clathrus columnatus]|uniref:GDP-mannose 4,6-dehydratase n=1 Tax=Clathrus columnatus TaxID=1419009 RepID=A0AAV5AQS8_9AGAM|nr:hypothetical protein Clacol_010402 [Clathrus columnatus]
MSTGTITHLFATAAPAPGHLRPLALLGCKLLIAHRRLRPESTLIITMPVTGSNIKTMADKEIQRSLHSENESLRENFQVLYNFTVINLGGEGILVPLLMHLMQNFAPFYTALHKCEPITCQMTGKVYTVPVPPNVVIADFFTYDTLALIHELNERDVKKIPMLTWNCGTLAPIMRLMGPEGLGGIGNVETIAVELSETTGITLDEAIALIFQPQAGEVIKVPGLPPMYDYEFFAKSDVLLPELLQVQLRLHKQGYIMFHDLEGTLSSSCTAFEPEACAASRKWYAERNKSFYAVGPAVPEDLFVDGEESKIVADFDPSSPQEKEVMSFLDETSGKHFVLYLLIYGLEKMGDYKTIPDQMAERIKAASERGLKCIWAPQQAVLAHEAVGWFLTHCGNNGVQEAISQAVPMIAWPLDGEQPGTAAYLTLNLDIAFQLIEVRSGLGLKPMYRGCQAKGMTEALEEEIRTVLLDAFNNGENGNRKRKNIQELRKKFKDGLGENGDSTKDLERFVEEYLSKPFARDYGSPEDYRKRKVALISGITGQDGSYLTELLIEKGYEVHGIIRRSSSFNTGRLHHLYADQHEPTGPGKFILHYGDLSDSTNLVYILSSVQPSEVYNLGAQSHVKVSFEMAEYTADVDGLGTLRLLDAIRTCGLEKHVRFYQASTSELYGKVVETPQSETTPFYPRSPYGVAKLYAYWITVNYREAYGMYACNGILFNHESPRRGRTFVTRKISRAAADISLGKQGCLYLGNLDAQRDWGHGGDKTTSEGMWRMLQQPTAEDFVLATGETHPVREFVEKAFRAVGMDIRWQGSGVDEVGIDSKSGRTLIRVDPKYFRPAEVDLLLGNPAKAERLLGWKRKVDFESLVKEMVKADLVAAQNPIDDQN